MRNHLIVIGSVIFTLVILNEFRIVEAVDINVNNNDFESILNFYQSPYLMWIIIIVNIKQEHTEIFSKQWFDI